MHWLLEVRPGQQREGWEGQEHAALHGDALGAQLVSCQVCLQGTG